MTPLGGWVFQPPPGAFAQTHVGTTEHAGLHLSVRELIGELASIGETVLLHHHGGKGRPRAQRLLTDMTDTQHRLYDLFDLERYAPTR